MGSFNFDTTGTGIIWNYSGLVGSSQRRLVYRLPTQTGYSNFQWPYIFNTSNTNLSSTDGETVSVLTLQASNPNDYFLKSTTVLQEKASSYNVALNGVAINLKNIYTNPDTIYHFPITYGNAATSHATFTTNIPGIFYRNAVIDRRDTVKGWGTVVTPYGTFPNCLKLVSTVTQKDSVAVYGTVIPTGDTSFYREISWLDPSKRQPVLKVVQNKIAGIYITQSIEYLDNQHYYQPHALFGYYPIAPIVGDTVTFQNLSTNAYDYKWNFTDAASGSNDSSNLSNPQHIFNAAGTYNVKLIAFNGPLSDTTILPVVVGTALPMNFSYFKGTQINNKNQLNWETYNEQNIDNFIVEKSTNGTAFLSIGKVLSKRNNASNNLYQFVDDATLQPINYYRLKVVSKDGKYQYSSVVAMQQTKQSKDIQLMPNIISKNQLVVLSIKAENKNSLQLRIFSGNGSILYNTSLNVIEGTNFFTLPVSSLSSGIYVVQCINNTNHSINSLPLIIQ